MTFYSDSAHRPSAAIDSLHEDELRSFSATGTWGSAAQRNAVAALTRKVLTEAGVLESSGDDGATDGFELPAAVQRLVREVALGGVNIDREFYTETVGEGVTEGAYVEIVGLVSRIVNLDIFARGIGVSPRPLAIPVEDGKPSFKRPVEATDEGFFVASVPNAPAGGELAKSLYGKTPVVNLFRALSLVPDEARRFISLIEHQYFPASKLMDFGGDSGHALSRAQIELVATKVSQHNQCFY